MCSHLFPFGNSLLTFYDRISDWICYMKSAPTAIMLLQSSIIFYTFTNCLTIIIRYPNLLYFHVWKFFCSYSILILSLFIISPLSFIYLFIHKIVVIKGLCLDTILTLPVLYILYGSLVIISITTTSTEKLDLL